MNLKEAQQFVGRFVGGDYRPEEREAFSQWVIEANIEELTIISDTYESDHGKWVLPGGPSAEWMARLEQKLDVSVGEQDESGEPAVVTVVGDREWEQSHHLNGPRRGVRGGNVRWGVRAIRLGARTIQWNGWMSAAALVVVLSAGTFLYVHQSGSGADAPQDRKVSLSMTVMNPRGGAQKAVVLEDGSKVWLNAASVLKYPAHFSGAERLVELSGEAFFDVARRSGDPFRVLIKDAEVDVLGTYFTIMAYDDEPGSRTILVNGAVMVIRGQASVVLKPGEQAEIAYSSPGVSEIAVQPGIDLKKVLAWKSGIYHFKSVELHTIMRELERVYDVSVQYQANVGNPQIDGNLDLKQGLDIVLKQLEGCMYEKSKIHFTINGKTVIASSV